MNLADTEIMQRISDDLLDRYDEEFELEFEDQMYDQIPGMENARESPDEVLRRKEARRQYFQELFRLQIELVKLQDWVAHTGHKVVILFEGRDAAGKGKAPDLPGLNWSCSMNYLKLNCAFNQ